MKILISLLLFAGSWIIFALTAGCTKTDERPSYNCEDKPKPQVDFTAEKTTVYPGDWVNFSYTGSDDVNEFRWSFPGSTTDSAKTRFVTCIYTAVGDYTVYLLAKNDCFGVSKEKVDYIHVIPYKSILGQKRKGLDIQIDKH